MILTPEETVKGIFTTLPENIGFSDALLWIGTSLLVTWMLMLTVGKTKRAIVRAAVLSAAAVLGFVGYILYQNINEHLGGYYLKCRPTDDMLFPEVETDPDAPPRDYLIYFPGSIRGKRFRCDIVKTEFCAVLPHGYNDAARRFAARLRPKDRLHLVGFSRGGGEALAVAQSIRRPGDMKYPVASLVLADPTADILQAVECRLRSYPKPRGVEFFKVFTVRDYDAVTDSNESIRRYLFFMIARHIDRRYVEVIESDHGMRSTGYRIDESDPEAVKRLRLRVIADHDRAFPPNR